MGRFELKLMMPCLFSSWIYLQCDGFLKQRGEKWWSTNGSIKFNYSKTFLKHSFKHLKKPFEENSSKFLRKIQGKSICRFLTYRLSQKNFPTRKWIWVEIFLKFFLSSLDTNRRRKILKRIFFFSVFLFVPRHTFQPRYDPKQSKFK